MFAKKEFVFVHIDASIIKDNMNTTQKDGNDLPGNDYQNEYVLGRLKWYLSMKHQNIPYKVVIMYG